MPSKLSSLPLASIGPQYSSEERLLFAIAKGLPPSDLRREISHVERVAKTLQRNGLIAPIGRKYVNHHFCNAFELTQEGFDYMIRSWTRETRPNVDLL